MAQKARITYIGVTDGWTPDIADEFLRNGQFREIRNVVVYQEGTIRKRPGLVALQDDQISSSVLKSAFFFDEKELVTNGARFYHRSGYSPPSEPVG